MIPVVFFKVFQPGLRVAALVLALVAASCGSPASTGDDAARHEAIARVLAIDEQAGAVRNQAPRTRPLDVAVREYADALRAIDLSSTPPDFRAAWIAHTEAWEATIPYLRQHSELRGEMHGLFDQLLDAANPTSAEFQRLHAAIWSTWDSVERARTR